VNIEKEVLRRIKREDRARARSRRFQEKQKAKPVVEGEKRIRFQNLRRQLATYQLYRAVYLNIRSEYADECLYASRAGASPDIQDLWLIHLNSYHHFFDGEESFLTRKENTKKYAWKLKRLGEGKEDILRGLHAWLRMNREESLKVSDIHYVAGDKEVVPYFIVHIEGPHPIFRD